MFPRPNLLPRIGEEWDESEDRSERGDRTRQAGQCDGHVKDRRVNW